MLQKSPCSVSTVSRPLTARGPNITLRGSQTAMERLQIDQAWPEKRSVSARNLTFHLCHKREWNNTVRDAIAPAADDLIL